MRKTIDLTGQKFGRLTVIKKVNQIGKTKWLCQCECGNTKEVYAYNLIGCSCTQSCGCLHKETVSNPNKYDLSGEYGKCYLYSGDYFIFDLEDYDKIKGITWTKGSKDYIGGKYQGHRVLVHRIITDCPKGFVVDHINHNKNDNRKQNLRICTIAQNNLNKSQREGKDSITGVAWIANRWQAYITLNNKDYRLGRFEKYEDAVKARKEAEQKYFGEFAYHSLGANGIMDKRRDTLFNLETRKEIDV